MNEENGQIPEKATEEKGGDTHPPVSVVNTAESCQEGPKGTEHGDNAAGLQRVSRWRTFWRWLFPMTAHEAGILLLTIVIATSTTCYTIYAKRQWKVMRDQLSQTKQQLVGTQGAIITFANPGWITDTNSIRFTFQNNRVGSIAGNVLDFSVTLQRESLPDRKPIGDPWIVPHHSKEPIAANGQWTFDLPMPCQLPNASMADWPGKEGLSVEAQYAIDNGFGDTIARNECFDWLPQLTLKSGTDSSTTSVGGFVGGPCPHDMNRINWQVQKFKDDRAKGYTEQQ